jgi:tryptophanyl-tRNA synthetase
MVQLNLVSGARLAPGGLHLGHYLGCVSPLFGFSQNSVYFFVVEDVSLSYLLTARERNHDLLIMLVDLMAASSSLPNQTRYVLDSSLQPDYIGLLNLISLMTTTNQLEGVHPRKKQIRSGAKGISVKDFLFPMDEVCRFLLLDCDYVLMNDDNSRFVDFARKVARKVNNEFKKIVLSEPVLRHGVLPRLLGYDYRKMNKGNQNCIFLSDSGEILRDKVAELCSVDFYREWKSTQNSEAHDWLGSLPDDFLPFDYLRAFRDLPDTPTMIEYFKDPRFLHELGTEVLLAIERVLEPMREPRAFYHGHPEKIWTKLEEDTEAAKELMRRVSARVLSA